VFLSLYSKFFYLIFSNLLSLCQLTAVNYGDSIYRYITLSSLDLFSFSTYLIPFDDTAEHYVLVVQPGCLFVCDKELRAICVFAGVGHGEESLLCVREPCVLVVELGAVDGHAARAVAVGGVTPLHHEFLDHAVEDAALVVELRALLSRAERSKVLSCLWDMLWEQLKDHTATLWLLVWVIATYFNIEKYLGVASFESRQARGRLLGFGGSSLFSIETLP